MPILGAVVLALTISLASAQPTNAPAAPAPEAIAFNFKDAPFDLVIDFFSRESGLPVIREAEPPAASMTFISAERYPFDEALSILNLNLRAHGRHLRLEDKFLYLSSLEDAARKAQPAAIGDVPADLPPDRMVTVTIPLSNAIAATVAEQVKPLIGPYGAITPVEAQNMVILVESADQARRISDVIRAVDASRPVDSEYRMFTLEHAEPEAAVEALKGLVGQREKTVIIDQKGKQRVVEDLSVPGLNIQADPRTRSVIAVGPKSRIDVMAELIELIDRPDSASAERELRTFVVDAVSPKEAKRQLEALFAGVPEGRRPTVLAMDDASKVGVVASPALLLQARGLLDAMDPSASDEPASMPDAARIIPLEHIAPERAKTLAGQLLTPRQQRSLRLAVSPNNDGLIVAGPEPDVLALSELLRGLDTPPELDRSVRLVRIAKGDPNEVMTRAMSLLRAADAEAADGVDATVEPGTRTATLVGPVADVRELEQLIASVAGVTGAQPTPRVYEPTSTAPGELAARLRRLAPALLADPVGPDESAPRFDAMDDLGSLVVRATPRQHPIIEGLIARLDRDDPTDDRFRVVRLRGAEPEALIERADALYDKRAAGDPALRGVVAEYDAASGALLLSGSAAGLSMYADGLDQLQRLTPPARTTRLLDVRNAEAARLVEPLRTLLAAADPIDPARAVPDPTLRVVEGANALLVTAEDAQHRLIESYVRRLDVLEPTDLPPLKLLQLRTADAAAIASMLNQQYAKRPQSDRAAEPVDVRADTATNTLIVSAHARLFDEIRGFVEELNIERLDGPERVTVLFPLKVAKAVDVAAAMDRLYPEPPMPRDRRGNPMPWLQEKKEVSVSADASSNALIIDAPADRLESLRELASKLDRVELPPIAQLRTYRVIDADLQAIARTLSSLSRQGNLSGAAQPGKPPVQVVIETEPRSGTLIVAGDDTTFERVEAMLEDLSAVPVERALRVAPISNASAADVGDRALAIYEAQIAGDPGAGTIEVSVDEDSNSLMIVGDD
ncbi:MAG: secretin N-terminal domain-containing protein, partial [Planctomycetota bacterium]